MHSLPPPKTRERIVYIAVPSNRLFFRGDVVLVKHVGELEFGHEYIDTQSGVLPMVEKVLRKIYSKGGLEKKRESDARLNEAMHMHNWCPDVSDLNPPQQSSVDIDIRT